MVYLQTYTRKVGGSLSSEESKKKTPIEKWREQWMNVVQVKVDTYESRVDDRGGRRTVQRTTVSVAKELQSEAVRILELVAEMRARERP